MKKIIFIFGTWVILSVVWTMFMASIFLAETGILGLLENPMETISVFLTITIFPISLLFFISFLVYYMIINHTNTKNMAQLHLVYKKQFEYLNNMSKTFIEFKNQADYNSLINNSDYIYSSLLNQLLVITESLNITPRNTGEHPLWQLCGGLVDAYTKSPHILTLIRKNIKCDDSYKNHIDSFNAIANDFLEKIAQYDKDRLLYNSFAEGLLGQVMGLFTQLTFMDSDLDNSIKPVIPEQMNMNFDMLSTDYSDWNTDNNEEDDE